MIQSSMHMFCSRDAVALPTAKPGHTLARPGHFLVQERSDVEARPHTRHTETRAHSNHPQGDIIDLLNLLEGHLRGDHRHSRLIDCQPRRSINRKQLPLHLDEVLLGSLIECG